MAEIRQLPGTEAKPSLISLIKQITAELPQHIEYIKIKAHLTRIAYRELRNEGFDHKEALELSVKIIM